MFARLDLHAEELLCQVLQPAGPQLAPPQRAEGRVLGGVADERGVVLDHQRVQVVRQPVAHDDAPIRDLVHLSLHLLERRSVSQVLRAHTAHPGAIIWRKHGGDEGAESGYGGRVGWGIAGRTSNVLDGLHVGEVDNLAVRIHNAHLGQSASVF